MGRLLARMLGANARPAVAMFQSLTGSGARLDALWAAAHASLKSPHIEYLDAGVRYARKMANQRHAFAHHIWGVEETLPDALLLLDPKERANLAIREREYLDRMEKSGKSLLSFEEDYPNTDLSRVNVYLRRDFETFSATAHNAAVFFVTLGLIVDRLSDGDLTPEVVQRLIDQPEFQTVLSA